MGNACCTTSPVPVHRLRNTRPLALTPTSHADHPQPLSRSMNVLSPAERYKCEKQMSRLLSPLLGESLGRKEGSIYSGSGTPWGSPTTNSLVSESELEDLSRALQDLKAELAEKEDRLKAKQDHLSSRATADSANKNSLSPFQASQKRHEAYQRHWAEQLEQERRNTEAHRTGFKATPSPTSIKGRSPGAAQRHQPPAKDLTHPRSPRLSSTRRAAARARFDRMQEQRQEEQEVERQRAVEQQMRNEERCAREERQRHAFKARPSPFTKGTSPRPAIPSVPKALSMSPATKNGRSPRGSVGRLPACPVSPGLDLRFQAHVKTTMSHPNPVVHSAVHRQAPGSPSAYAA